MTDLTAPKKQISIWWFAFGYFAVYVPYSFFTKVLTKGLWADPDAGKLVSDWTVSSGEILPPTIMASIIVMLCFISIIGWWKYATQWKLNLGSKSISLPRPRIWTLLSGICTGFVVVTTTLAYTIDGVSIVFAMLLMRGGMLIMSPIVDTIFKRHVRWFSWAALACSVASLLVSNFWPYAFEGATFGEKALINTMLAIDLVVYLASYFFRLSFMSKLAKSENDDDTKRFFVEEQMVGTPSVLLILFIAQFFAPEQATTGFGQLLIDIHNGFFTFWQHPTQIIVTAMFIGFFSQFNGVFGGLILLVQLLVVIQFVIILLGAPPAEKASPAGLSALLLFLRVQLRLDLAVYIVIIVVIAVIIRPFANKGSLFFLLILLVRLLSGLPWGLLVFGLGYGQLDLRKFAYVFGVYEFFNFQRNSHLYPPFRVRVAVCAYAPL